MNSETRRAALKAAAEKDTRSTVVPHTGESTHTRPCEYPDVRPCLCPDRPPTFTDSFESIQRARRCSRIAAYFVSSRWARRGLAATVRGGAR